MAQPESRKRPNILLITSDQQHWNTIGAFNKEIKTPNLDRLVREGTTFGRAYCPNPTCTPSRSSIITGMYPSQHGAWSLGTKLLEDRPTVGDALTREGYRTALVGKAHFQPLESTDAFPSVESFGMLQNLDYWKSFHGPYYGFQHVELARNHTNEFLVGQHYALWMEEQGCANWRDYFTPPTGTMDPSIKHAWAIPEEYHYDRWIAERSIELMEQYVGEEEPFFLWSSFFDPHPPYLVPAPWDTMYDPNALTLPVITPGEHDRNPPHFGMTQLAHPDFSAFEETGKGVQGYRSHLHITEEEKRRNMATYYGMISLMDKYIGKLLDRLDKLGIADNTIVIFTTDHGHLFGHHGLNFKGGFHYEDMIRLPFLVRYPEQVPAAASCDALQSLVDLAPTMLSFAGIDIPLNMTGKDQSCVWRGEQDKARDYILCEHHQEPTTVHQKTYVDERYKLTLYYKRQYGELFDLVEDPGEIRNLWDDPTAIELKSRLLLQYAWAELEKEPMPVPRIGYA